MMPRCSKMAFGCRNPSVVTKATVGVEGHLDSSSLSNLETVDFPTATDPATPIMKGIRLLVLDRKLSEAS